MSLVDLLGYGGAFLLTVHSIPQVIKTIKTKDVSSFDASYLWMWCCGATLMFFYILLSTQNAPLLANYSLNVVIVSVLLYYFYRYQE